MGSQTRFRTEIFAMATMGPKSPAKNAKNTKKTQFQDVASRMHRMSLAMKDQENLQDTVKSFSKDKRMSMGSPLRDANNFNAQTNRRSSVFSISPDDVKAMRLNGMTDSTFSFTSRGSYTSCDPMRRIVEPKRNVENNFHLEPTRKPSIGEINEVMQEILNATLHELEYDHLTVSNVIKSLNVEIHNRLRQILRRSSRRHAMTLQVYVVQKNGQDVFIGSRSLFNPKHDDHTTALYESKTLTGIAICHLVYTE